MPNERVRKLQGKIAEAGGQAMLVGSDVNRRYLSGFTGSHGVLLISEDRAALITDFRYQEQAPKQAAGYEIVVHGRDINATIADLLKEWGIGKILFEDSRVTFAEHAAWTRAFVPAQLLPAGGMIEDLRVVKDASELAIMQEAADLADRTFEHILGFIKPGLSELEVAVEMETFMRKNGASGPSFDTIVASGERSALPHGKASERIVGRDEFVKFDFGALYKGYCSDLTRTIVIGKPSDKHKEIYAIVKEAQQYALDHLKPGMTGREGDALTRDIITRYGYGDHFGHGTGHGLGMEIHEAPRLSLTGDFVLQPGMVVTVEPGIYLPGFGGVRIEDDVVITETGIQILTRSPKELIVLD
ncbi:M24 family metallopeptidase [Cohnella candidum]|uniref:Aminopeptidase P family protein n=1 Tax=Cohnella candidum TaxID=2674991 RepID=A0A3G3JXG2_9BACL|nr:Xaa-Pro peptidase family protein [Cohnella candidum]AYQ72842.1 aminopeptidase P family protein [Cohnella candidum]